MPDDLLNLKATCAVLGVSRDTFIRWARGRRLAAWKVGGRWYADAASVERMRRPRAEDLERAARGAGEELLARYGIGRSDGTQGAR